MLSNYVYTPLRFLQHLRRQPQRAFSLSDEVPRPTMAVRRETINVWERRAPIGPAQVRQLIKDGIRVLVQPSNRRAYTAMEYNNAGAIIQEDISEASLIIGVKQVPLDHESLIPNKTYAFFSHTIKAQEANMSLLDMILERNIRLVDYERMLDSRGQRLVAFGKFAGSAGMINILHGLGLRFLALGSHTPFMHIGLAHNYPSAGVACQAIRDAGYEIALGNMPKSIGPLVFVFTGSGNVSSGAQEIFQQLPYEYVDIRQLEKVATKGDRNKIYGCVASRADHFKRRKDGGFDSDEFDAHPELYSSTFAQEIAPYASVIINGIYYAPSAPRLLSIPNAKHLLRVRETSPWLKSTPGCPSLPHRLVAICDISCDPGGSIEFMQECTTIDKPFCLYDAEENMSYEKFDGPGVLICSIDNMPAQLPREATNYFGESLLPHIYDMIHSKATQPFDEWKTSETVKNATITSNGSLTPNYSYIASLRESNRLKLHKVDGSTKKKSVLLLGSGFVVPPVIQYLQESGDIDITLCSTDKTEALHLADKFSCVTPDIFDVSRDPERISQQVKSHDLVISMLPYNLHELVLDCCLRAKKNLLTASYLTPKLKQRSQDVIDAGIMVMMEVGLDPGIDHMLAMEIFDEVREEGGRILSYKTFTGGLPAPEHSNNPLRYKFSWSPESAMVTSINPAKFILDGKVKEIPGGELMRTTRPYLGLPGFNLEAYPNRDSTVYAQLYGNLEGCKLFLRGTLRYSGFSDVMWALNLIGLLDPTLDPLLHPEGPEVTWKKFIAKKMNMREDVFIGTLKDAILQRLAGDRFKFDSIEKLGLFDSETPLIKSGSPIGTLSTFLSKQLSYGPDERDVIIMTHETLIEWSSRKQEKRDTHLVVYGKPADSGGYLAMATTVGLPCAIAAKMMLDAEIQGTGFLLPLKMDVYRPILKRLRQKGIFSKEVITCSDPILRV